jgi:hypothetical protein
MRMICVVASLEHRALSSDTIHAAHIMKFHTQVCRSLLGSLALCVSVSAQELEVQKLTAPTPTQSAYMGHVVALEGLRMVAGQYGINKALVFDLVAGSWTIGAELAPPVGAGGLFGWAVGSIRGPLQSTRLRRGTSSSGIATRSEDRVGSTSRTGCR